MKKAKILSMLLCCALMLTIAAACDNSGTTETQTPTQAPPPETGQPSEQTPATPSDTDAIYTIDFTDGNTDFIKINTATRGTDPNTAIEVKQIDGEQALAITAPGGGNVRIGIDVKGLLGDKFTEVKTVIMNIYAECPDGNFSAVGGEIRALRNSTDAFASSKWSVYIYTKNPNQAILELGEEGFVAGEPGIIELACLTNGPASKGETPAVICIKSIEFYDTANSGIPVDTTVKWAGPEEYGEGADTISYWQMPNLSPLTDSGFSIFYTYGVDNMTEAGIDDYMPWSVLSKSIGIVFEMDQPDANIDFIHLGEYNDWGWTEDGNYAGNWEDGRLTIMWEDTSFDPTAVTGSKQAVKLYFGNWSGTLPEIKTTYLICSGGGATSFWQMPSLSPLTDSGFSIYYTYGVDNMKEAGIDDYMPWSVLASSYGIVFEMDKPEANVDFIHLGEYNDWGWTEDGNYADNWEDGKLTILWEDTSFDPSKVTGGKEAVKLYFGNWSGTLPEIKTAYLLCSKEGGVSYWQMPSLSPLTDSGFSIYYTYGVDNMKEAGIDDYMPWYILSKSIGIVFEMDNPDANVDFIHLGEYNDWGWTEDGNYAGNWEDGKLTIMWGDTTFNPTTVSGGKEAVKLYFGNWSGTLPAIKTAYLLLG